jgi:hypothetical protein
MAELLRRRIAPWGPPRLRCCSWNSAISISHRDLTELFRGSLSPCFVACSKRKTAHTFAEHALVRKNNGELNLLSRCHWPLEVFQAAWAEFQGLQPSRVHRARHRDLAWGNGDKAEASIIGVVADQHDQS